MSQDEKLPRELVWDGAHVSDLGLTAMADGQEALIEPAAMAHVDACEWCGGRLGRAALLAEAVGRGIAAVAPASERAVSSRAPRPAPAPKPWRALSAGVAVAFLTGLPMLARLGHVATVAGMFFTRGVPVLAKGGYTLASSDAVRSAWPAATLAASALLVVMGLMIAGAAKQRAHSMKGSVS
jgi:hypothetical protein